MKKEQHLLTNIDVSARTGLCCVDGEVEIRSSGKLKPDGSTYWRCAVKKSAGEILSKRPYSIHKKDSCEACGFVPELSLQLDVDHIDGNNSNNDPDNLQTLCANCHRLKTYRNKDYSKAGLPDIQG
jgi:5-methylcytosine-specific restriction endonuclease McrA